MRTPGAVSAKCNQRLIGPAGDATVREELLG
jgi:hypothetical protein